MLSPRLDRSWLFRTSIFFCCCGNFQSLHLLSTVFFCLLQKGPICTVLSAGAARDVLKLLYMILIVTLALYRQAATMCIAQTCNSCDCSICFTKRLLLSVYRFMYDFSWNGSVVNTWSRRVLPSPPPFSDIVPTLP